MGNTYSRLQKYIDDDNKYNDSKIYIIIDNENKLYYIGSTIIKVSTRISNHKSDYKRYISGKVNRKCSSFKIIKNNNYRYNTLLYFSCKNDRKKCLMEKKYVETYKYRDYRLVNNIIPSRTRSEYYEDNKEKIAKQRSEKITCECGITITRSFKTRHKRTAKHRRLINQ